jgi:hypothetical protein
MRGWCVHGIACTRRTQCLRGCCEKSGGRPVPMPSVPDGASPLNTPHLPPPIAVASVVAQRTSATQLAAAGGVSAFGSLSPSK